MQCKCWRYNNVNICRIRTNEISRMWSVEMFLNDRINRKYEVDGGKSIFILPRVVIQMQIFTRRIEYGGLCFGYSSREIYFRVHNVISFSHYIFFFSICSRTLVHIFAAHNHKRRSYDSNRREKSISNVRFSNPIGEWS